MKTKWWFMMLLSKIVFIPPIAFLTQYIFRNGSITAIVCVAVSFGIYGIFATKFSNQESEAKKTDE
jgi:hypothetical protein